MHLIGMLVLAAAAISAAALSRNDKRPELPAMPQNIVSLNLCADQYLLALADRSQIAALTQFASDPAMSAAANEVRGLKQISGSAEEVLALQPDLIIASPTRRRETMAVLKGYRLHTFDLPSAENYTDVVVQIREVAQAVGHPDRGEALIARMDAALARLQPVHDVPVAAYYQRRGYLTGTDTLVDDLMTRVGLVNLADQLDRAKVSRLSIEQMVAAKPDYLIVEGGSEHATDRGNEMLRHPALAAIPRLRLPQAWTVCGGPAYVSAAESLVAQMAGRR